MQVEIDFFGTLFSYFNFLHFKQDDVFLWTFEVKQRRDPEGGCKLKMSPREKTPRLIFYLFF